MLLIFITIFFLSILLTSGLVGLATRYKIVDTENERTLHSGTKPRAGGAAIVACIFLTHVGWVIWNGLPSNEILVWWGVGYGIAGLGLVDDLMKLSVAIRLLTQLTLAIFLVANCISWPGVELTYLIVVDVGFALGIVWAINGANFMDGADGLLSSQAVIILITLYLLAANTLSDSAGIAITAMGAACLGFLSLNWEPSKIFLGDVGSYFVGFYLLSFLVVSFNDSLPRLLATLILLLPLYTDASLTLLRRVFNGEKFWQAHRSHVYQMFVLRGYSHRLVSSVLAGVTVLVFVPLAYFAWYNPHLAVHTFASGCIFSIVFWVISHRKISVQLNTPA